MNSNAGVSVPMLSTEVGTSMLRGQDQNPAVVGID